MEENRLENQFKRLPYLDKVKLAQILSKEKEALNYWIKKLIAQKRLIPLKKGFYTSSIYLLTLETNPFERERYFEYLANMLRYPSYLSLEYMLAKYGFIPEAVYSFTSVTLKSSRTFTTPLGSFIYRKIKPSLFGSFQQESFREKTIYLATPAKALFDFLYYKKFTGTAQMKKELTSSLRINWDNLKKKEREKLEELMETAKSVKLTKALRILKKEEIL